MSSRNTRSFVVRLQERIDGIEYTNPPFPNYCAPGQVRGEMSYDEVERVPSLQAEQQTENDVSLDYPPSTALSAAGYDHSELVPPQILMHRDIPEQCRTVCMNDKVGEEQSFAQSTFICNENGMNALSTQNQRIFTVRPQERITDITYKNPLLPNYNELRRVRGEIHYDEGEGRPLLHPEHDVSVDHPPSAAFSSESSLIQEQTSTQTEGQDQLTQSAFVDVESGKAELLTQEETAEEENLRLRQKLRCEFKPCMNIKNAVFDPCGHNLFCMRCAKRPMDCPRCGGRNKADH